MREAAVMATSGSAEVPSLSERRVLENYPLIALGGIALHGYNMGTIGQITFGKGIIAVDDTESPFSQAEFPIVILTTLGFTAEEAARATGKAQSTAQTQLKHALYVARETSSLPIRSKAGLARYCFMNQLYKLCQPGERLNLSEDNVRVVERLSYGETSRGASQSLGLSPQAIHTRVRDIARRSKLDLHGREQIVLAAFLSGEISF